MQHANLRLLAERAASTDTRARSEHHANLHLVRTPHPEDSSPVQNYRALQRTAATMRARRIKTQQRGDLAGLAFLMTVVASTLGYVVFVAFKQAGL